MLDRELKKGSAELIILSIIEPRARHGYEISKLIEARSAGQRRRRFYSLTAEGRRVLARQRDTWRTFVHAMRLITGVDHA